jgi:hypothetical protein
MVPPATFESYYGRPILKEPAWEEPDVPMYLTLGGLAGASSVMAAFADLTGRPALGHAGRVASGLGAAASVGFLVHDLGRPSRFLNMLRVFKPTSPLSVGSWILAPYGTFSGLAMAATVGARLPAVRTLPAASVLPMVAKGAGGMAAALGPALATYTAVLLADTAVPAWHEAYPELPFVFAGSALASGAGAGLIGAPCREAGPARRMAVVGAAVELAASRRIEHELGLVGEPYSQGLPGRLLRAGRALTVAGVATAVLARRSRPASAVAGSLLIGASLCTRWGVFKAGIESSKDPKYVVVPQRAHLEARRRGETPPRDRDIPAGARP